MKSTAARLVSFRSVARHIRRIVPAALALLGTFLPPAHAAATTPAFTWGNNGNGALGNGGIAQSNVPVAVDATGVLAGKDIAAVATGQFHSLALDINGVVYAWGDNNNGQLGNNSTNFSFTTPVAVDMTGVLAGKTITAIAAGDSFSLALDSTGKVYAWGYNGLGTLGNNSVFSAVSRVPVAVTAIGVLAGKTITRIAAGSDFALALASDGTVYSWGSNGNDQLGRAGGSSAVPVAVDTTGVLSGKFINAIAAGAQHAVVTDDTGKLYSWGFNNLGQLGNSVTGGTSPVPVAVSLTGALASKVFITVAAGQAHCLAMTNTGELYTWGDGTQGQMGNGFNSSSNVPVAVTLTGALAGQTPSTIGCGYNHCIIRTQSDRVFTWGPNSTGALGIATAGIQNLPVAVDWTGALNGYGVSVVGTGSGATRSIVIGNFGLPPSVTSVNVSPASPVTAGTGVTFTSTSLGGVTYQWRKDGVVISGAINPTYTISSTATGDTGTYSLTATNAAGSFGAIGAFLQVNAPSAPVITTQPASITVNSGASASFTVVATGTGLSYQWFKGGVNISGANAATYTIPTTAVTDSGNYTVAVTNSGGSVTSNIAVLAVNGTPVITTQPVSLSVPAGNGASFAVVALGGSLSYQWFKNGGAISGANATNYAIANVTAGDAGAYTVTVTNGFGSVTSNAATLTVNSPPVITTQPASQTVLLTASVSFTVGATGATSYQWTKGGVNIPGANSATYTIPSTFATDAGNYAVVVTNGAGSTTSNTAVLTVTTASAPVITTQPSHLAVSIGAPASFTVGATGTGLTYQWKKGGVNIVGANAATFTIPSAIMSDGGSYSVAVTNAGGTVTSNAANLTINTIVITAHPVSQTVTAGASVTFSVAATGSGPLSYAWIKNSAFIPGATNPSYTIAATTLADAGTYSVSVVDSSGATPTNPATLTVTPPPLTPPPAPLALSQTIAFAPTGSKTFGDAPFAVTATASSGLPVTLSVSFGPATLSGSTLTITGAGQIGLLGFQGGNSTFYPTDASVVFTVAKAPATVGLSNLTATFDGTAKSATVATNPTGLATVITYNGSPTPPTAAGTYTIDASINAANYTGSASGRLVIAVAPPVFILHPVGQTVPTGEAVTFTATVASAPAATFQWRFNGAPLAGATSATYSIPAVAAADAGDYSVVATNPGGTTTSRNATLAVNLAQHLANLSARAQVGVGDNVAIAGFVIDGIAPRAVLLRAVGPTLGDFNLPGAIARPALGLFQGATRLAQNTGWGTAANAAEIAATANALGAFALRPNSADSAILITLAPGAYSTVVNAADAASGLALVEVYDTARAAPGLLNLSCRGLVGAGNQVFITGFVLRGDTPRRLLVRAVGPGLGSFGVAGTISDPQVQIFRGSALVASNDNWGGSVEVAAAAAQAGAFSLGATSRDAALLATLDSGNYSLVVSGVGPAAGVVLVEVYQLP